MSADNLIYVKHRKDLGKFVVLDNLSASVDYTRAMLNKIEPHSTHDTLGEAIMAAHVLDREGYYEYGVQVDHLLDLTGAQNQERKPE